MKKNYCLAIIAALLSASVNMQAAEHRKGAVPGASAQPRSYFYTGKPYDQDLDSYVFAFRSYSPNLNRWTSADPSGFPDGANNRAYIAIPTLQLDALGLTVTAVYSITTQTLTIGSNDNEFQDYHFYSIHSGDDNVNHQGMGNVGPLPIGTYNIYSRHQFAADYFGHEAFILDPNDSNQLNDHWDGRPDGIGRGAFRIHVAGDSQGCIACSQIDQIAAVLQATSHTQTLYTIHSGADTFTEFFLGSLTVIE